METPAVTPPEGVIQLLQTGELKIKYGIEWFKPKFTILGTDKSFLFTTKGICNFKLRNKHAEVVAEFRDTTRLFAESSMSVVVWGIQGLPLELKFKKGLSKSLLLIDGHKIILKIKKIQAVLSPSYYEIWTAHPITGAKITKIGCIKKGNIKSLYIAFPPDLEIKWKIVLIGACVLLIMEG